MVETSAAAKKKKKNYGPMFNILIYITNNGDNSQAELGGSYPAPPGVQDARTILAGTQAFRPNKVEVFYLD